MTQPKEPKEAPTNFGFTKTLLQKLLDTGVGTVGFNPGAAMASADTFTIRIVGKGCHGADPGAGLGYSRMAPFVCPWTRYPPHDIQATQDHHIGRRPAYEP